MKQHYAEQLHPTPDLYPLKGCHAVPLSGERPHRQDEKAVEIGRSPAQATLRIGFFDQRHLTDHFSRFIGLSPGIYRNLFIHC